LRLNFSGGPSYQLFLSYRTQTSRQSAYSFFFGFAQSDLICLPIIRNDIVAIGILALIIFLAASLATYDQRDPAHEASSLLNQIYQPDQLYFQTLAVVSVPGQLTC